MKNPGKVKKEELFTLEDGEKEYDISPQMIEEFRKISPEGGIETMNLIYELINNFRERTFYMVKKVAQKTGIKFPHLLQAYIELLFILKMGIEKYKIKESTRNRIITQLPSCPLYERWCGECEKALKRAGEICELDILIKNEKDEKMCTFTILPEVKE